MKQVFPAILHFGGDDMAKKRHDCTELLTLARSLVDHNCSFFEETACGYLSIMCVLLLP